jgi:hypothetical protein
MSTTSSGTTYSFLLPESSFQNTLLTLSVVN